MKSYREELYINIPSRRGFVNITPQMKECLEKSGIQEGLVLINAKAAYNCFHLHQDYEE